MSKQRKYLLRQCTLLMVNCLLLLCIVMVVKRYAFNIYRVTDSYMEPLLRKNDRVFVNKLQWGKLFSKGELVVFKEKTAGIAIVENAPGDTVRTDSTAFALPKECACRQCSCQHENYYLLNIGQGRCTLVRKTDIVGRAYNLRFWK